MREGSRRAAASQTRSWRCVRTFSGRWAEEHLRLLRLCRLGSGSRTSRLERDEESDGGDDAAEDLECRLERDVGDGDACEDRGHRERSVCNEVVGREHGGAVFWAGRLEVQPLGPDRCRLLSILSLRTAPSIAALVSSGTGATSVTPGRPPGEPRVVSLTNEGTIRLCRGCQPPEGYRASAVTMSTSGFRPPLLGRRAERAALDELVVSVRAGPSRALVLRGEAGVGKSALLDYLVQRASGWSVEPPTSPPTAPIRHGLPRSPRRCGRATRAASSTRLTPLRRRSG